MSARKITAPTRESDGFRYYADGAREDTERCIGEVRNRYNRTGHQCQRPRTCGQKGEWCDQHEPRMAAAQARRWRGYRIEAALRNASIKQLETELERRRTEAQCEAPPDAECVVKPRPMRKVGT